MTTQRISSEVTLRQCTRADYRSSVESAKTVYLVVNGPDELIMVDISKRKALGICEDVVTNEIPFVIDDEGDLVIG